MIPDAHALLAHAAMPGSRLEAFDAAGHSRTTPPPTGSSPLLHEFVATTEPAEHDPDRWQELLRRGPDPALTATGHPQRTDDDVVAAAS